MRTWIEHADESIVDPSPAEILRIVADGHPFWLDIEDPTDDVIDRLAEAIELHPLAVEDSKEFGQRGKLARYGDVAMLVGFGAENGDPLEVHAYVTAGYLITLRREASSTFERLHRTSSLRPLLEFGPIRMLHYVISELHAEFRIVIDEMDDRLDELETRVLNEPTDHQLVEIAGVKQHAAVLRRTLTPGRDLAARSALVRELPGAGEDADLYVADISDELHLLVADLTAVGDRSLGLLSLHSSLTSNRQGVASRQLAAIATIFLPVTFVVGFFGMNFNVLVNTFETGWMTFLLLGIGLNLACVAATFVWLGRRGWR